MAEQRQIYKCEICGNIVEVLHPGQGELVCCGQPMTLLEEKTEDIGKEKHLPVMEETENGIIVRVGSTQHPMEENHYIEWIEVITENETLRKHFQPGEAPEAFFPVRSFKLVRAYCNVHGLWKLS